MKAYIRAGIPVTNKALYHRMRFAVGDPAVLIEFEGDRDPPSVLILRDIEMARARRSARARQIACPADFAPEGGLSGDREVATAQAAAECLRRHGVSAVTGDRSLPLIYVHQIRRAGLRVECDPELGIRERRIKDERELHWLRQAQGVTEAAMERACRLVASARARASGELWRDGCALTSERVRHTVDVFLLEQGYSNSTSIVAGGPAGADCHAVGHGGLKTEEPVIIDVFPQHRDSLYHGDCTRTVVHGQIPDRVKRMHAAVVAAKARGMAAARSGVTGEEVHRKTIAAIQSHGFGAGPLSAENCVSMTHGTGHGIGLDVHEPPLLDFKGPRLLRGDVVTIEPGVYDLSVGGVRVEDMVAVGDGGCENVNRLPEGLTW